MTTCVPVAEADAATTFERTSTESALAVSVVICAYTMERWDDLAAAVGSIREQTVAPDRLIVVVDHDDELAAAARTAFPDALVLENDGEAGLSDARNTGVAAATGEIVAFLDDDAVASPRWIEVLLERYADPGVAGAGGRIEPAWETRRPRWFPEEFDWVVGCSYKGSASGTVRNMIGANMSFRRSAIVDAGGFRSGLGRTATKPLGCEETDLCIRVSTRRPGTVFVSDPRALVRHHVPASRCRWSYFRARCWAEGLSKAALSRSVGSGAGLSSERRHALVTLPIGAFRAVGDAVAGRDRAGLAKAAAIVAGLAVTAAGYMVGTLTGPRAATADGDEPAAEERPRVLMVTPRYLPLVGGVENHVYQVARRMADRIELTILTTDASGGLPAEERVDGVRVVRVRAWPRDRDWYVAPGIVGHVLRGHWDLVHVQSYHTAVAPIAMLSALFAGVPFVLTFHGGGHSSRLRRALRQPQWTLLRPLLARARRLVAVARFEADFYARRLRIPRQRFVVLPNGSDLPAVRRGPRPEGEGRTIASIGRLERYKGHDRVIRALRRVLETDPDVRLRIIGSGPYEEDLRRLAEERGVASRVTIGPIPADDRGAMAEALASLDLLVCMSEFETHPLTVVEAVASGCPVLAADTSGLREMADDGLARPVPLDIGTRGLARAIVEALRDPAPVPDIEPPRWDDCADGLLSVYRDAMEPLERGGSALATVRGGSMRT